MMISGEYYQCQHVRSMTAGRCLKCLEKDKTAAPTTSNISNEPFDGLTINGYGIYSERDKKALSAYIEREKVAARIDEVAIIRYALKTPALPGIEAILKNRLKELAALTGGSDE